MAARRIDEPSLLCLTFGLLLALPGAHGLFWAEESPPAASLAWVSGVPAGVERFKIGSYTSAGVSRSNEGCRITLVDNPRVYVLGSCGDVREVGWNRSTAISLAFLPSEEKAGAVDIRALKVGQTWILDPGRLDAIEREDRLVAAWMFWGGLALTACGLVRRGGVGRAKVAALLRRD